MAKRFTWLLVLFNLACIAGFAQLPTITSFAPSSGGAGTVVTITGTNFTGAISVKFGETSASSFIVNSSTSITATVSIGNSGSVFVTTAAGFSTLPGFTFIQPPSILCVLLQPFSNNIQLQGYNLTGATAVTLNNTPVTSFTVNGPLMINAVYSFPLPGNVYIVAVTTPGGNFSLPVAVPANTNISSFSPATVGPGDTLTINGSGIGLASGQYSLYENSCELISAAPILQSPDQLKFLITRGCQGTLVSLRSRAINNCITNSIPVSGLKLDATPVITDISPSSAKAGDTVVITGKYLYFNNGKPAVNFGGVAASAVIPVSYNTVKAVVSIGAIGNVTLTNANSLTATYAGFTFIPPAPPTITSFIPLTQITGGTVTITGTNFAGVTAVSFGGIPATSFTVINATTITAVVGAGASGNIAVTTYGGTVSAGGFTITSPTITSFTPTAQITGSIVTITGTNLTGATAVKFGGVNAASFTIVNATTITAVIGAGNAGDVTVTTAGGTATKSGFTIPAPTITSFTPVSQVRGGIVTITGTNLTGTTAVTFGGLPDSITTIVSSTSVKAVVGGGASGQVSLTTGGGTATLSGFTFIPPAPVITSFAPASQIIGGTVTITGTDFSTASAVSFGGVAASSFTVVNAATITATVGIGASGLVSVTALGGMGTKAGFTIAPPTITSFTPTAQLLGGTVTITGANFTAASAVSFGGLPASSFTVVNAATITAVVAKGFSGAVSVSTPGGTITANGFTYIPPPPVIQSFTPATQTIGGTVVITGANFTGATVVSFGGSPAYSFTVSSDSTITAVVGTGSAGNLIVTTPWGTTGKDGFVYTVPPVINSFFPLSGSVGAVVTITGDNFSPTANNNTVIFGGIKAVITAASKNSLTVIVPNGAAYLPIAVITNKLTAWSAIPFVVTFPGNDINANSFSSRVDYATGIHPKAVAYGDIDGDGKQDIIVCMADTASVFINISKTDSIILAPKIDFLISCNGTVAVSDINGDGKADIVCSNGTGISILKNTSTAGNISFTKLPDIAVYSSKSFALGDINKDGKTDIAALSYNGPVIFTNAGDVDNISFAAPYSVTIYNNTYLSIAIADLDGDGKTDIAASNDYNVSVSAMSVFKNNATPYALSFSNTPVNYGLPGTHFNIVSGDYNGDGTADILYANASDYATCGTNQQCLYADNKIKALNNVANAITGGTATLQSSNSIDYPTYIKGGSLNGDDKADIIAAGISGGISLMQNTSSNATIAFSHLDFTGGTFAGLTNATIVDLDGDGKADIAGISYYTGTVNLIKNKSGEPYSVCAGGTITLTSNIAGAGYQWQVNTGSGFTNISNNTNYSGVTGATLTITNVPAGFYGYQYRCVADGSNSYISSIKITDQYIGTAVTDQKWETSTNWSCGVVPDSNTDVIINSGTVTINSQASCRSLTAQPNVTVTVNTGAKLTIVK